MSEDNTLPETGADAFGGPDCVIQAVQRMIFTLCRAKAWGPADLAAEAFPVLKRRAENESEKDEVSSRSRLELDRITTIAESFVPEERQAGRLSRRNGSCWHF